VVPDAALITRFRTDFDALSAPGEQVGIAVSGGPDSLALLLLATTARPGLIEAATVDHDLRSDSRAEAEMVAGLCDRLHVPHAILTANWPERPATAIQEKARAVRYSLLSGWLEDRGLDALATGHHADDQAETLIMRLNRGAGLKGLAGMRPRAMVPGSDLPLIRPLLVWRRAELERICRDSGIEPAVDPSNTDENFERVRIRNAIAAASWLDPAALAQSAANLDSADEALGWMVDSLAAARITDNTAALEVEAADLPAELQRRLLLRAFGRFHAVEPRGRELTRALEALVRGETATLSGLKLMGGRTWRISRAPDRRPAT
jgi:tRNA(Ile)-lysidine synthase